MDNRTVRVLVVDDHDLFRTGLASLLAAEDGLEVVGQASGGRMGVRLAAELRPDVVLLDLRMPDIGGPQAAREMLQNDPQLRVLVLTVASEDRDVAEALQAGACGFMTKDTPIDSLVVAIRAAVSGSAWLSAVAAEVVLSKIREGEQIPSPEQAPLARLSPREIEVLRLIAKGMENAEIADRLGISPRTAKNHVSNILSKLELPSRVQAAVYAVRQGVS